MRANPNQTTSKYWDPAGRIVTDEFFANKNQKVKDKLKKFQKNPKALQRNLWLLLIPAFLFNGFIFSLPGMLTMLASAGDGDGLGILGLVFAPAGAYYLYIRSVQKDLIKFLVAEEQGWCYNPEKRGVEKLKETFPEVFPNRGEKHRIDDEFWGKFNHLDKVYDFYSGIYTYQVTTGSGKNRSTKKYTFTLFATRLPKPIKTSFRIESKQLFRFKFGHKRIKTESSVFNKNYEVSYKDTDENSKNETFKNLSPAVIEKLIELKDERKNVKILFQENTVFFAFQGRLIPKLKTNFFKKVEINPADKISIANTMNRMLTITSGVLKYLD